MDAVTRAKRVRSARELSLVTRGRGNTRTLAEAARHFDAVAVVRRVVDAALMQEDDPDVMVVSLERVDQIKGMKRADGTRPPVLLDVDCLHFFTEDE